MRKRAFTTLILGAALLTPAISSATSYVFDTWSFPTIGHADTSSFGFGNIGIDAGPGATLGNANLQFDNVPFTPTTANSVAVNFTFGAGRTFTIDFGDANSTNGLILGLGNFGHDDFSSNFPGYFMTAVDANGAAMSTAGITQIGSYDHTWLAPFATNSFNDDIAFNSVTGLFSFTTVPGLNDRNSDMAFLRLPGGITRLTIGAIGVSQADTINVTVATQVTPEPATILLLGSGVIALVRKRKS